MNLESFHTSRYQFDIEFDNRLRKIALKDTYSGVEFADSEYRYSAFVEYGDKIVRLEGLYSPVIEETVSPRAGKTVIISGHLGEPGSDAHINVRQMLYIPEDGEFLEERIALHNKNGKDVVLRGYRFGFRKRLAKPERYGGKGIDIEDYRLVALPFRLQPDGKKHDYQLDDLYHGRYACSEFHNVQRLVQEVVDKNRGRSEGWAWTNGENGLLVIKYNPDSVEYSMLDTEYIGGETYLTFGGASPSLYNEPTEIRRLSAGAESAFGKTRYHFYEGLWRRGSYMFREFMNSQGHGLSDNYDPPIHWNELYNIGWHHNDPAALSEHYNLETLECEAAKAREVGCDTLYLDPGWETCEGATSWDSNRLGDPAGFVNMIKEKYGLNAAFRTIGRSYCDDYPGMYRRRPDGSVGYYAPYDQKPFYEPCVCSWQYQEEKLKRIRALADAGMSFIMFDEFDWRGGCYNPDHGHPVPTTPNMHAHAVVELAKKLHKSHPNLLIELHDPVWPWGVRYLPMYFLHEAGSFDESWAFEFMWNPLEDLLSGKALSLFYYNLSYEIPLYTNINMDNDNDNCLAFWWYASTVRHLGIGGGNGNDKRFEAYKQALSEYKGLKDVYCRGRFFAPDELTHIHVLPESGRCVVNAFNLTDTPLSRKVNVRLSDLGFMEEVTVEGAPYQLSGDKLTLDLQIPPFSPMIVKVFFKLVS
ncbi:MAG: hypothetical protein ABFD49_08325 [Armatimonadota bacterium]|nr:hypothetical protein [bacterium]